MINDDPTWHEAPRLLTEVHAFIGACYAQASLCAEVARPEEDASYRLQKDIARVQQQQRAGWRERTWSAAAAFTTHHLHSFGANPPTAPELLTKVAQEYRSHGLTTSRRVLRGSAWQASDEYEHYCVYCDIVNLLNQIVPNAVEPLAELQPA